MACSYKSQYKRAVARNVQKPGIEIALPDICPLNELLPKSKIYRNIKKELFW